MSDLDLAVAAARAAKAKKLAETMSYDGTHPRQEEASARQAVADFATVGVPQGVFMGGADELAGMVTGDLDGVRAHMAEVEQRSPSAVQAGKLTAAALTSVVPMAGAMRVARGLGIGGRMVAGAGAGSGVTATQGFLEGEGGAGPRVRNAMEPAPLAVGAGTGAAAPVLGGLIGGAARGARDLYGATANSAVRGMGYDRVAAREVAKAFQRDSNFVRDAELYLRGIGPEGQLSDLGTNTRNTARGLAGMPGEAGQRVALTAADRQRGRTGRVLDDMDNALGTRQDADLMNEGLRDQRRQQARQAYDAFYQQTIPLDPQLRDVLRRADAAGGMANAKAIAAAEGHTLDPSVYLSPDAVAIDGRGLDAISRSLRDASQRAWREGNGELGSALGDLNDALLDRAPSLRDVRRQYARDSDLIAANEDGASILSAREPHRSFQRRWDAMSPAEQAEFRLSARDALANEIDAAVRADTKSLNLFGPTNTTAKLRTVFGPQAMRTLERRIAAERAMAETDNRVRAGSDTAATREFQDAMAPYRQDGSQEWLPMRPVRALNELANRAVNSVVRRNGEVVTSDMARALTAQGSERDALVRALMADAARSGRNRSAYQGLERAVTRALLAAPGAAGMAVR